MHVEYEKEGNKNGKKKKKNIEGLGSDFIKHNIEFCEVKSENKTHHIRLSCTWRVTN